MKEALNPTLEEALHLHEVLIQRFGGIGGILYEELLDKDFVKARWPDPVQGTTAHFRSRPPRSCKVWR